MVNSVVIDTLQANEKAHFNYIFKGFCGFCLMSGPLCGRYIATSTPIQTIVLLAPSLFVNPAHARHSSILEHDLHSVTW